MIRNPYYTPEFHGDYEMFDLGDFVLEEGYTLRDCQLAYMTFGELNEAKDKRDPGHDLVLGDAPDLGRCLHRAGARAKPG